MRLLFLLLCFSLPAPAAGPNLVFVLADDLGYGDVRCLNPQGKIATPQLDRLRAEGMSFTDAHSGSAVCTPTRYGLLTGRYAWRSRLKHGVLGGMSPPLIEPGRLTVPAFLKSHGYATACIGKWHLGLDWVRKPETAPFDDAIEKGADGWRVDFTQPFAGGPLAVGFDHFFGIAASLDMVPYVFLENERALALPVEDKDFPMMAGKPGGRTRRGPAAPDFEAGEVLPALTSRAVEFVRKQTAARPFFLYVPLNAPHTPIVPSKAWQGRSGINPYADFVMETDDSVGRLMDAVEAAGLRDQTLFILASDNGCSPQADLPVLRAAGHEVSAGLRGAKADLFEGGHRVPLLVRWPGRVLPGSTAPATVCLTDLLATCAELVGQPLPPGAGEDSVSLLPLLEQRPGAPARPLVVHHSINGSFSIREGRWKLLLAPDSGGWSAPTPGSPAALALPAVQLFDLSSDPAEQRNVQALHPEVVTRLTARLEQYARDGRSTPGPAQPNTTPVSLRRKPPVK